MQVPEEQADVARWTVAPGLRDGSGADALERGATHPALFSTEYAHVGPLDHGYDGHASSKENARIPAQKHSVITRKPVGACNRDTRLAEGQDRQRAAQAPQRKSREPVSVVPTLTCRQEKRFGLADPKDAVAAATSLGYCDSRAVREVVLS
ncbi:hypothetical protein GGTG_06047 [Gaeumannomyces tritici R3-111a-1]|uniref:Uncharacterized protein n=1 Tax=Gaeumannomyces tritici (strain R3-111a-1) TaxID=644352 RepID=J3NXP1_GAET3|nr:hypothetical protein GGTG_06047 [Gaeumannomyces tritici R3-111a-1]EJT76123.1 hypothetical protein GGTG_06047 [Gaeumannomyces tritici R3-111a-1]